MRKSIIPLLTAAIVVSVVFASCVPGAPPTAPPGEGAPPEAAPELPIYSWRLQSDVTAPETEEMQGHFAEMVEIMSEGRIHIDLYAAGELVPIEETLPAMAAGTIDMGCHCGAYSTIPDIGELDCWMPFTWLSITDSEVIENHRGLLELEREAYAESGVHYITSCVYDPLSVITTVPINSLEDFDGLKIMMTGSLGPIFARVGVAPIDLPIEEAYLALQTGALDGICWGGAKAYYYMGHHEATDYYLGDYILNPCHPAYMISLSLWEELPEDLKAIIYCAAKEESYWQGIKYAAEEAQYREEGGWTVTHLPEEDLVKLMESAVIAWTEYAKITPRNAKAIDIIISFNVEIGKLDPSVLTEYRAEVADLLAEWEAAHPMWEVGEAGSWY